MKICPHCQTSYTDDSLQFCLQDGAPLAPINSQNLSEPETLVSANPHAKTQADWQNPTLPSWTNSSEATRIIVPPRKSNTGLVIALTALITLLVIGGGIAGFLFYRNNQKIETAQNANNKTVNVNFPTFANANQKPNANVTVSPSPTVAPSVKPTLNPQEAAAVKSDIGNVIADWKNTTESGDLDAHLNNYAETVDYYKAGKVNLARVRADQERAYQAYDNLEVNISDVKITPDETGQKASAIFDKEWNFQNDVKSNSGKVRQQLTFEKIGGRWLITGEKDLKVYYVNK